MSVCINLVGMESVSIQMGGIKVNVMKDTVLLQMVLAKIQMNVKMYVALQNILKSFFSKIMVMKLTTGTVLMWMNAYRTFVAMEPNV